MDYNRAMMLADALESGEYKQGERALRNGPDMFCCLGVACDLYAKEHPEKQSWSFFNAFMGETAVLPKTVKDWFGFKTVTGGLTNLVEGYPSLLELNDGGKDFKYIAKVIRNNWERL